MRKSRVAELTNKIIAGYRLSPTDDRSIFMDTPLEELSEEAYRLQKQFCGNHIDLCTIVNGRSGRCGENCKYCAQAACHKTGVDTYGFLPQEQIMAHAKANQDAGANRFSIVTSGGALSGKEFEMAIDVYKEMRRTLSIDLCASHGLLTRSQFRRLREVGVTSYHHNIETSERYFPEICTTHSYADRIRTIKMAQAEGLCVCSGGIIGMGETWEDRFDMAFALQELGIESIPLNSLMAIPGTPLEHLTPLSGDEILRTIAIFRFINPTANIRLGAGRKLLPENGATAFLAGASASITGNMLTTSGTTIAEDMELIKELGFTNRNEDCSVSTGTCGAR
ncbi:biotin synthase BioB [Selenomonas noxia]|jgi:biotin synthase|uniref:biotin synthase BioB n=1 Tax=Selenomonas noxia TaxID=135083 RepID=UPI0001BCF0AF|nr:biotin synthase BioB [Selenomonas noxia]EFF66785.1 biotin synthase [Selenomonas noxia ATCC 43541]MBF1662854.1 biotin synthase BioB [Selenomonas noxia]